MGFSNIMAENCNAQNTLNLTNEEASDVTYSLGDTIFITVVMPIVTIIGTFNNFAFLFVICRIKVMQNVTNFYLANLAIADVSYLMTMTTRYIWNYFATSPIQSQFQGAIPWTSPFSCQFPNIMTYTTYFASVFLITMVAIERYFAICHSLRHRVMNRKTRATALVVTTWLLSISLSSFYLTPVSTQQMCYILPDDFTTNGQNLLIIVFACIRSCTSCIFIVILIDIFQFLFALTISSALYTLIVLKVMNRDIGETNTNTGVRNAVVRMVIINSAIFFICSFPFQIVNLQDVILEYGGNWFMSIQNYHLLNWIGRVSSLVNAAVNPVVYNLTNSRYRQAFLQAFGLKKTGHKYMNRMSQSRVNTVSRANILDSFESGRQ